MSEAPPHVPWRDEFSIGVASIDHEHRELIGLINQIFEHLDADDPATVTDDLGEVHARISGHFALEEQVMRDNAYDQYLDHKSDHERLLDDIRDIMDAYEDGSYTERRHEFVERLQNWFIEHFKTKDARLHRQIRM